VNQLESRVLAGIKMHLSEPALLAEFIHEFNAELRRLQACSTTLGSESKKQLADIGKRIDRIVSAIADGTDTPSLRRALLSLENEKVELERATATYHRPFVEPPPVSNVAKLFRRKVERLEESLGAEPAVTSQAATILRTLINNIVLHPRTNRGTMSVEVYGEPSALFLHATDGAWEQRNWMITVVAEEGLEPPTRGL
jgi:site-specific DNA recombinase